MDRKEEKKRKSGLKLIAVAVLLLCGVITYNRFALTAEQRALEKKKTELSEQLTKERERAAYLKDQQAYMQTTAYLVEMAREKLGLVFPDDVIFRPEDGTQK